jgi:two-component system response regulator AtoC
MKKILIVDDEEIILGLLQTLIKVESQDYQVMVATDPFSALEKFKQEPADLLMLDLRLPGMNGLDLLEELKKLKPDVKTILMTAYSSEELSFRARQVPVEAFLHKPFQNINEVMEIINIALAPPGKESNSGSQN